MRVCDVDRVVAETNSCMGAWLTFFLFFLLFSCSLGLKREDIRFLFLFLFSFSGYRLFIIIIIF